MTRICLIAVLAFALVVPSAGAEERRTDRRGTEPLGRTERVRMVDGNRFRPVTLRISRGTRVRWVNRDNVTHTTTSEDGLWDERLEPGERFARRFRRAGTFDYECTIHFGMDGTIVVG